jgi:hypothetical protein
MTSDISQEEGVGKHHSLPDKVNPIHCLGLSFEFHHMLVF